MKKKGNFWLEVKMCFIPRPTKGGGYHPSLRFVSGSTKTQKKVTPGI